MPIPQNHIITATTIDSITVCSALQKIFVGATMDGIIATTSDCPIAFLIIVGIISS